MKIIYFFITVIFLVSCNQKEKSNCDFLQNPKIKDSILNSLNSAYSLIENSPKHINWKNQEGLSYTLENNNPNSLKSESITTKKIEILEINDTLEIKYKFILTGTEEVFPYYQIKNDTVKVKYLTLSYAEILCNNGKPEIQWMADSVESSKILTIKLSKKYFQNKVIEFRNKLMKIE